MSNKRSKIWEKFLQEDQRFERAYNAYTHNKTTNKGNIMYKPKSENIKV
jgi:hypothetical protein